MGRGSVPLNQAPSGWDGRFWAGLGQAGLGVGWNTVYVVVESGSRGWEWSPGTWE